MDIPVQKFKTHCSVGFGDKLVQISTLRIERGDYIVVRSKKDGYFSAEVEQGKKCTYIIVSVYIFAEIKTLMDGDWVTLKDGRIVKVIGQSVVFREDEFTNNIRVRPLVREPYLMNVYNGEAFTVGIDDIKSLFIAM